MKIFFDTEFIEDGNKFFPQLISIGLVKENGEKYYAELHVDWSLANNWVLENVAPKLRGGEYLKPHNLVRDEIRAFVGENPEFWAYFADYDWVIFCNGLFGNMISLPEGWPMYCRDLKQLMWHLGIKKEDIDISNGNAHLAIDDAIWNLRVYLWIKSRFTNQSFMVF